MPKTVLRAGLGVTALAAIVVAVLFVRSHYAAESTPALRGERIAREQGCFACHGPDGKGGVADPGARGGVVPGWDGRTVATYALNEAEVVEWILEGRPARLKDVDLHTGRKPLLPMPAYRDRMSAGQLDDLMAYFRAVSAFDTNIPALAYEGMVESEKYGCFACHGPGGVGGAPNPGSFKGHIPAWDGAEYAEIVRDEGELREWILDGHPRRLWDNPAARHFLEGQLVQMPVYRRVISDDQLAKIMGYVQWRRTERPAAERHDPARPTFPPETGRPASPVYRSPLHIVLSPDGRQACVVNYTANLLTLLDVRSRQVIAEIPVGERPTQARYAPDGRTLYVSCTWGGKIDVVDLAERRVVRSLTAGHEPCGLTVSADGRRLYVTNVVSSTVSILDTETGQTVHETPVGAQPRFATLTPDGARLAVSNGLSPWVSILDARDGRETGRYDMGRASMLREIVCSPDGRWAFLTNLVSHNEVPTVQMERGWINSNGFTVLDLAEPGRRVTLLLDQLLSGATNPSGLVLSADARKLYVSLAGIHEIAIVDVPAALALAAATRTPTEIQLLEEDVEILHRRGIARRLPAGGLGPRSLALSEATGELWVANYFSDTITVLDAETGAQRAEIALGPVQAMSTWREGELMANDGRITYQNWISCTSCHQEDTSSDGLNWDLANDGLGNAKNNKSLQDTHFSPPAMWSGVRADVADGVGAGERFQGFVPMAHVQGPITEYLSHPDRAPSPYRHDDPVILERGKKLFAAAGCDVCHPAPFYTDLKFHDLGFGTPNDFRSRFDTPSLKSTYRTAPYLHDGRAADLRTLFTEHNPDDLHGRTRGFSRQELDDLIAYVRTL
ncbi:Cytochrome c [Lacunisphaera limnophila]|uniref:Cytochrome c n=1 Tax=Lacunisphaera limnophila TaxID=1838286 RepID=A0A1D8AXI9_9BACT|nr:c-type cytochrome [Lacunisphaera limnophila]AOS45601.1 Cytochrome c [Lacunisphaera limnophila]